MATGFMLGSSTTGTTTLNLNVVLYAKFTATGTGEVSELLVYTTISGNAKVAIYSDNAGTPGDKIVGNDVGQACTLNQWNTLSLGASANVVSGTVYWLAINTDTSGVTVRSAATGGVRYSASATYATWTWPASAGGGLTPDTRIHSIQGYGIFTISSATITQTITITAPRFLAWRKITTV